MLSFRLPCFQENWCLPSGQHQRGEESSENYLHSLLGSSGLLKYTGVSANLFHWFDFSVQNNVCVCSCVHACMFACKCSCGSQRFMTGVFLNHFPLYVLGWVFFFSFKLYCLDNFVHLYNAFWLLCPHPFFSSFHPDQPLLFLSHLFPDAWPLAWFCDPLSLTRVICVTTGLRLCWCWVGSLIGPQLEVRTPPFLCIYQQERVQ